MANGLRRRVHQPRFESPTQETLLNLLVAAAYVRGRLDRPCAAHALTLGQYHVLRILRGAFPGGYPRCEIARRIVERAPDLTRMIGRLATRGLVERGRSGEDRRHSITRITRKGLELLDALEPAMDAAQRAAATRLSRRECAELSRLCERLCDATD